MPSKSAAQHRLMAAVANNPKFAKKVGIPVSVGKDFMTADKSRRFKGDGDMKAMKYSEGGMMSKKREPMMKMAKGGSVYRAKADGCCMSGKTKCKMR
jgi:hypothetical protein